MVGRGFLGSENILCCIAMSSLIGPNCYYILCLEDTSKVHVLKSWAPTTGTRGRQRKLLGGGNQRN
jgi:hypothetical protein